MDRLTMRRTAFGFTLMEVLIALVISSIVITGAMTVFRYQHKNWLVRQQITEMELMSKGVVEEISRTLRMAGGQLPSQFGGVLTRGSGPEAVSIALNQLEGTDSTLAAGVLSLSDTTMRVLITNVNGFSDQGHIVTTLRIPSPTTGFGQPPNRDTLAALPVKGLRQAINPSGPDTLIVGVGRFLPSSPWPNCIAWNHRTRLFNVDSVHFRHSGDTILRRRGAGPEMPFAVQVESFRLQYRLPTGVWLDSLPPTAPDSRLDRARITIRVRTRTIDPSLRDRDPSSGGYRRMVTQAEVVFRNASTLRNR